MVSKRFLLISGGTVAGLGAVLSITPPQFGSSGGLTLSTGASLSGSTTTSSGTTGSSSTTSSQSTTTTATPSTTTTSTSTTPATTTSSTKKSTKKTTKKKSTKSTTSTATTTSGSNSSSASNSSSSSSGSTSTTTSTPASTPKSSTISGTFTGDSAETRYGPVQVQVTIVNNKITAVSALTYPTESFRDQQINSQAIPLLQEETLAAQSANIQGVGGASYTSQGWADSLQSALSKAGL